MQYSERIAYKCAKCGRTLLTRKGKIRHASHCKYTAPIMDGQLSLVTDTTESKKIRAEN